MQLLHCNCKLLELRAPTDMCVAACSSKQAQTESQYPNLSFKLVLPSPRWPCGGFQSSCCMVTDTSGMSSPYLLTLPVKAARSAATCIVSKPICLWYRPCHASIHCRCRFARNPAVTLVMCCQLCRRDETLCKESPSRTNPFILLDLLLLT